MPDDLIRLWVCLYCSLLLRHRPHECPCCLKRNTYRPARREEDTMKELPNDRH